jgi:hypothetical protein
MIRFRTLGLRLAVILTLALAGILGTTQAVRAEGILYGSTISAGSTIENDAILWGDNVTVAGDVQGDVFAFGRTVTVTGNVEGSLFTGGQTVTVGGQIGGSTYAVGSQLNLGETSTVGRTAYLLALRVATAPGSIVGRDLKVLALGAQLSGTVDRDSRAVVGILEWIEIIVESIDWQGGQLRVDTNTESALDTSREFEFASTAMLDARATVPAAKSLLWVVPEQRALLPQGDIAAPSPASAPSGQQDAVALQERLLGYGREFVALLVIGTLSLWLLREQIECWSGRLQERTLAATGLGLVSYVAGFGVPALLAVLIFATGLALALATFWTPAFILWGVGYSALGLAFFAFLFAAIYGSKIIVAYLVGSAILGRWAPKVARYWILPLLLGLVIYVLLRAIPILGWVIGFVVTFAGLGAICIAGGKACTRPDEIEAKAPAVEEEEAPAVEEA